MRGLEILNLIYDMQEMDCWYSGGDWNCKNPYTVYAPKEACYEIDYYMSVTFNNSFVYNPEIRYINGPCGIIKIVRL